MTYLGYLKITLYYHYHLLAILFSLAGIPPLAGFFAKFYIFKAVIEQSMYFLAIVGLVINSNSCILLSQE
jgi:NADH:ubiquinone oxidoreductase subunit 2 (subunit N)